MPAPMESRSLERLLRRTHHRAQQRREDVQQHGAEAPRIHIMLLSGSRVDEAPVKIMHQVGGPPVEVRQDRRGVGGNQPADHQAHKAHRQEFQHRRERAVMADQVGIGIGKRGFDGGQIGEDNDGAERGNDPRPGPQHIMGEVEEQRAARANPSPTWRPACAARCSCRRPAPRPDTSWPTSRWRWA